MFARRTFLPILMALSAGTAAADEYPSRPLRWVMPYSVAGASDAAARLIAQKFAPLLGQQVIVENKPGAGGVVGTDAVAKAKPDGYTFVWGGSNALAGSVTLQKSTPYTAKDFAPVCRVGVISYVLVVSPALGVRTVEQLVNLAKKARDPIPYASPGDGGASHLSMEAFQARTGTEFLNVQYKGSSPGITELIAGHVQLMFESVASVTSHVQSGKLVALATTGAKRLPGLPNVPTLTELGYDVVVQGWAGILLPAGTPAPIVAKLDSACRTVLQQPDVQDTMTRQLGWEVEYLGPDAFGEFVKAEVGHWAGMLATAKVKPE